MLYTGLTRLVGIAEEPTGPAFAPPTEPRQPAVLPELPPAATDGAAT